LFLGPVSPTRSFNNAVGHDGQVVRTDFIPSLTQGVKHAA
jgi:hypothetical protein